LEHHLLQTSHPESTVLLLYINSPCVVFGRNQNPWLEVNLARLGDVQLVRRRSGGGTVFHDGGNVNFSVICPPRAFDRDKHAEMVVRALKRLGKTSTRVNERHDIVMDVPATGGQGGQSTFKVSGSAYKLTRLRSLHHGTCLLRSPNLGLISPLLRSPAEPFIKARGVESVRSPVANVEVDTEDFKTAVVDEFERMYGEPQVREVYGDEVRAENEGVQKGCEEMMSRDWLYGQTPKFTFSILPTEDDPRERPALPFEVSANSSSIVEEFAYAVLLIIKCVLWSGSGPCN
jgi:lipoate-protein ligase A